MHKSKSARDKKRRGRKQKLLEVEVEFIGGEEARKRWDAIFKLLEAQKTERSQDAPNDSDSRDNNQLSLFSIVSSISDALGVEKGSSLLLAFRRALDLSGTARHLFSFFSSFLSPPKGHRGSSCFL